MKISGGPLIGPVTMILLFCRMAAGEANEASRRAFDLYTRQLEDRIERQHSLVHGYLATLAAPPAERSEAERELRSGVIKVEAVNGGERPVPGGLLHHWRGAAFVRGAHAAEMVALLRDYKDLQANYAPQVASSRLVSERGNTATVAMRLRIRKVLMVVLDTEYEVRTEWAGCDRGHSESRSIKVRQIDDAGTVRERPRPDDKDDGFLWRLNSYWSFLEVRGGLLIELEAVSLTRDVPIGLAWVVRPAVQQAPKESLGFTLQATVKVLAKAGQGAHR